MHIAFLIRSMVSGGAERAAASLTANIARARHRVTLLVLLGADSFYALDDAVDVRYLNFSSVDSYSGTEGSDTKLCRALQLRRIVRDLHPDILVGMSPFMSAYAVFCAFGTRTVAVGTERANPFVLYSGPKARLLRRGVSLLCGGFVCQTEKALSFFPRAVRRRAAVIPNGVFNPLVYTAAVPPQREQTITAMGRLDHNKGYDLLILAFSMLHKEFPQYRLVIYGDGELHDALLEQAAALGVADAVSLPGAQADAILFIARSTAFVLSSRSEGMPNALIEAMACGVPCVSTRCEMGPQELIEDGVNGLLVPPEDARAVCDALCKIIRYRNISDTLSVNALRMRTTHDPRAVADRWIAYFETLR